MLVGCNNSKVQRNTKLETDIKSLITMVSDKSESEINIKDFINFDWDKVFLIKPYTSQENIEKQIGVIFKDPSNITLRDDIYLLIFLHKDKVVQYAELHRQKCDFSIGEHEYLTPSNDLLYIKRY